MLTVPPKAKTIRRNETAELTHPIVAALNALPGVWCARNSIGFGHHANGDYVTWGLGTGSSDIFGCVDGMCFALEVKWDGRYRTKVQRQWQDAVASRSGMYCSVVHSLEEAVSAVEKCRTGAHLRKAP